MEKYPLTPTDQSKGGQSTSEAKQEASRTNGRKGGRPRGGSCDCMKCKKCYQREYRRKYRQNKSPS